MSDALTMPTAQWTVTRDSAVHIKPLLFYVVGAVLHATDDPANVVGHTPAYLKVAGSALQADTSLTAGLTAVVTPIPRLLAYT